jgi:hypothetical protein
MSFSKMLEHIDEAVDSIREAQAALMPTTKIKSSEAYILGSLKASLAVLGASRDIVKNAIDSQAKNKAEAKPDIPQLHD